MSTVTTDSDVTIDIDPTSGKVASIRPEYALVGGGGNLAWIVRGLSDTQRVEIDFSTYGGKKGPFRWQREHVVYNPTRGRYTLLGRGKFVTAAEDTEEDGGYWKYTVTVRDVETSKMFDMVDPGVMIKK